MVIFFGLEINSAVK